MERELLEEEYAQYGKRFVDFKRMELDKKYSETIGNPALVTNWVKDSLSLIKAANTNDKGDIDQIPGVGEVIIPLVYHSIVSNLNKDKTIDGNLYTERMRDVNNFFEKFLTDENINDIKIDKKEADYLLYSGGGDVKNSYFGTTDEEFQEGLGFSNYMKFYFPTEFLYFFQDVLGDRDRYKRFIDNNYPENVIQIKNFLKQPKVKEFVKVNYYDNIPEAQKKSRNVQYMKDFFEF